MLPGCHRTKHPQGFHLPSTNTAALAPAGAPGTGGCSRCWAETKAETSLPINQEL